MRNPEIRQKGESREDYVRRISKLPIIPPNTILRAVFPTVSMDTLRYIKDCARPMFPKAFPPEDSKGISVFAPEDISTKAFAKWVAEEDIFEALRSLGEKPSPTAELFIELALGKTGNPTKHSAKTKANKGRWAEAKKHRAAVRKVAKKFWEEDNTRTIVYIIDNDEINIIKKSDGTNYSEGTLRNWIKDLAPSNKPGRRK